MLKVLLSLFLFALNSNPPQASEPQPTPTPITLIQYYSSDFIVSGNAMSPTLVNGNYISLDKTTENFSRGDIIVLRYPKDPSQYFLKRIIGLPGETVEIKNKAVYINNKWLDESSYIPKGVESYGGNGPLTLGEDEYYVLGDNRTASSDSRFWGTLNKKFIVGKYIKTIK